MTSLTPMAPHSFLPRLADRLRPHGRALVLTLISLLVSAVPLLIAPLPNNEPLIANSVGLIAPCLLLVIASYPRSASIALGLTTGYSIFTENLMGGVVAAWFAILVLIPPGLYVQSLIVILSIAAGNIAAWQAGRDMGGHLYAQVVWLGVCCAVAVVLRSTDRKITTAQAAQAQALRNQRNLIARELHDTLARANTHIVLLAEHARAHPHDHQRTATALDDIITTAHHCVTDLRTMLRVLRQDATTPLDPTPPTTDLHTTLARINHDLTTAGLHATTTLEGDTTVLTPTLTTTLTRILDECAANIIKYAAPDAQSSIHIDITHTHAELLVINPLAQGRPHNPATSTGHGLLSIQERTNALGGTTTITPTNHQWILHTTLPLTPKDAP